MAEFGFLLGNASWTTTVDSGYSNYSLIKTLTVKLAAGVNTISLGVDVTEPMCAVRHPGITVAFSRYIGGNPSKVVLGASAAGSMTIYVFVPTQRKGNKGHGLKINDAAGLEVYHSDLFYFDVNNYVGFGTNIGSKGTYVLGSYSGIKFEYRDRWAAHYSCISFPYYGWVPTFYCDSLGCGTEYVWDILGYDTYCGYDYRMDCRKHYRAVKHGTDNKLSASTLSTGWSECYKKADSNVSVTSGDIYDAFIKSGVGYNVESLTTDLRGATISSKPTKLLMSDTDYAS